MFSKAASSIHSSKVFASASDSIKRTTGLDIHRAIGGKTAVEVAEMRLREEQDRNNLGGGLYGGSGGYVGIQIPTEQPKVS